MAMRVETNPLEAAYAALLENGLDDVFGLVDQLDQIDIVRRDHAFADQRAAEPFDQAVPERRMDQNDRNPAALAGLNQGQRLKQFVERAEASREND